MSSLPLAIVGVSFRHVSTAIRAQLADLDKSDHSPSVQLLRSHYATGIVRIETCSRTEWVISAPQPKWAAELLKSAFLKHMHDRHMAMTPTQIHVKTGVAALDYLLRLSIGMDSLVEGEMAVSRQVLKAFELAHERQMTDKIVHLVWKTIGKLVSQKRHVLPLRSGAGVEHLVCEQLKELHGNVNQPIAIIGTGHIGKTVAHYLQQHDYHDCRMFGRKNLTEFYQRIRHSPCVVVCSGAPQPWIDLPVDIAGVCIDVGSPSQVANHAQWRYVTLDELLQRPGLKLTDEEFELLNDLIWQASESVVQEMSIPSHIVKNIAETQQHWLEQQLPEILNLIDDDKIAIQMRKKFQKMAHELIDKSKKM